MCYNINIKNNMKELIEFLKEHNDIEVRFNYDRRHKDVKINIVNVYNPDKYYVGSSVNEEEQKEHKGNLGAYIIECLKSRLW